uniref:Demeter RRM-fold domain-containing protein n=1 Tax=Setaria italica TaxID=4555 RepID=K4AIH9_SETIT
MASLARAQNQSGVSLTSTPSPADGEPEVPRQAPQPSGGRRRRRRQGQERQSEEGEETDAGGRARAGAIQQEAGSLRRRRRGSLPGAGDRKFDYEHPWGGTVLTSVVGTFLTQNVTDHLSSNAFMNLAAEFSLSKNRSNVEPRTNVPLMLTDGSGLGESEPGDHGSADERGKCRDKGIEEFIASIRTGEISSWDRGRIRKLLFDRFESSTAAKIFHDIASIGDTSHWNSLLKEAYNNGYRKEESANETIDWDALLHAPFAKIAECIRDRGNQSQMALRILAFLVRIKRDHGSIDLEWLRHVDTNVARIVTRLGWVELQPLPNSQEFHLVNTYELHCQQITFGKSICTKRQPNCGACPFTGECKYFQSLVSRPGTKQMHQYQIEMGKGTERHCNEPIIQEPETPPYEDLGAQRPIIQEPETPPHEDLGAQSDEEFEQEYEDGDDDHIEDEMIDLRPTQQTENGATGQEHGKEIISIHSSVPSTPMIKRYRLRTEYTAVPDDQIPYLLIIRSLLDEYNVTATILVFADHSSSRSPIKIKREIIDIYSQCTVYFGTSIHSVTKGYICNREFDRSTRRSKVLSAQIHATNGKGTGRKRSMTSYVVEA